VRQDDGGSYSLQLLLKSEIVKAVAVDYIGDPPADVIGGRARPRLRCPAALHAFAGDGPMARGARFLEQKQNLISRQNKLWKDSGNVRLGPPRLVGPPVRHSNPHGRFPEKVSADLEPP
jgi:hypothetical protein